MLAIAIGGQRLGSGMKVVRTHAGAARKAAGVVVGVTAIAIALGADQRFTTALPGYTTSLQNRIEGSSTARAEIEKLNGSGSIGSAAATGRRASSPGLQGNQALDQHARRGSPLARQAQREGRARRLLDVLLHQLPAHASAPQGLGSRVPQGGTHDRRRPQSRVLVRARSGQRALSRAAPGRAVSGRTRQRLRDLACLLQRLLARGVPHRQVRAHSPRALR